MATNKTYVLASINKGCTPCHKALNWVAVVNLSWVDPYAVLTSINGLYSAPYAYLSEVGAGGAFYEREDTFP
jgi:hypothetical protein